MCTFTDKEIAEYIRHKKTIFHETNPHSIKKAVSIISKQPDSNTYVLGPKAIFDEYGSHLEDDESEFIWVSDLVNGVGVASSELVCDINPPSSEAVCNLFRLLPTVFKHNTIPAVLVMGAACMAFHYGIIINTKKSCGVPLAFGPSGTGKTMSLRCALALFGTHNQHMFQQGTLQFFANRCSESTVPFGIDDPSHSNELAEQYLMVLNVPTSLVESLQDKAVYQEPILFMLCFIDMVLDFQFEPKVMQIFTQKSVLHRMQLAYSTLLYFTTLVSGSDVARHNSCLR